MQKKNLKKPVAQKAPVKVAAKKPAKKIEKKPLPKKLAKPAKKVVVKAPAKKVVAAKPLPAKKVEPAKKAAVKAVEKQKPLPKAKAEPKTSKKPADLKPSKTKAEETKSKTSSSSDEASASEQKKVFVRPSAGIYFTLSDLNNYFASKKNVKSDEKEFKKDEKSSKQSKEEEVAVNLVANTKKTLSAASIADILGFNPIVESRSKFEEKDVPQKWKKYFKMLVELREKYAGSVDSISTDLLKDSSKGEYQGQDIADLGTENSERNLAFSMLSSEQVVINEINDAIERIKKGTYGICEMTGKPIPEKRLLAVPFARCSVEGQKQKEIELQRMRLGSKNQFNTDFVSDGGSSSSDEGDE